MGNCSFNDYQGRVDEVPKIKTSPEVKTKKKVGFNKELFKVNLY